MLLLYALDYIDSWQKSIFQENNIMAIYYVWDIFDTSLPTTFFEEVAKMTNIYAHKDSMK